MESSRLPDKKNHADNSNVRQVHARQEAIAPPHSRCLATQAEQIFACQHPLGILDAQDIGRTGPDMVSQQIIRLPHPGRSPNQIVGIGCHNNRQGLIQERPSRLLAEPAEFTQKAGGGDLQTDTMRNPPADMLGGPSQKLMTLGMRDNDAETGQGKFRYQSAGVNENLVRQFQHQIPAAIAHREDLIRPHEPANPLVETNVGPGDNSQGDVGPLQTLIQFRHGLSDLGPTIRAVVPSQLMGRGHNRGNLVGRQSLTEGKRLVLIGRSIVHAGKAVTMDIDEPPGRRSL